MPSQKAKQVRKPYSQTAMAPASGSAGIRTQDPYIKSVLLYQLSYRTDTSYLVCARLNGGAKVQLFP
jgi:hypothetical protein